MGANKKIFGWYITGEEWLPIQVDSEGRVVGSEPAAHHLSHENGGSDEIDVTGLDGLPQGAVFGSGTSFPASPTTGDFYKRTDLGNSVFQYDGANWQLIASGVLARAYMSADQDNIAANTWTKIQLNAESYDIGSNFNIATYGFVVPVTGYYRISGTVYIEGADVSAFHQFQSAIYVDPLGIGAPVIRQYGSKNVTINAGETNCSVASTTLYLNATDIIYLYAWIPYESDNDIESGESFTSLAVELDRAVV